jgi:hypothetical protein
MGYRQYTHCVQPQDYVDPLPRTGSAIQDIGAVLDGLILGGYLPDAILGCDYLLGGKLVCLGGDQCAIGHITHFEPASEKPFPQNLDNDFSFNILLSPDGLDAYAGIYKDTSITDQAKWQKAFGVATVATEPQAALIAEQNGMPVPHEDPDGTTTIEITPQSTTYTGYYTEYPDANFPEFNPSDSPFQVPGSDGPAFRAPALHLEAEGDRVCNVCAVISAFTLGPIGKAVCSAKVFGFPIGSIVCHIIGFLLLPFLPAVLAALLTAIAVAWAASRDGNEDDPRTDTSGGPLHYGDLIVATGRWVYDAGHTGWNEFHPLKTVQKIDPASDTGQVSDQRARWCGLLAVVPPFAPPGPGAAPSGMTTGQTAVWNNQRQPENQWVLHPAIDGCLPAGPPTDSGLR